MFENASSAVQVTVTRAADEAARRGDRRVGTDHLLLGLLHDAVIVEMLGVDVERARAAARDLDRASLEAIGIDLGEVPLTSGTVRTRHAAPTSGMRAAMARAFVIARDEHVRKVEPQHLLQALLEREQPDPAAALLSAMGVRQPSRWDSPPGEAPRGPA